MDAATITPGFERDAQRRSMQRMVQPSRPKALDLYCCAGGAGTGLHRAGYDVTGVDIVPQSDYPFAFLLGDALSAFCGCMTRVNKRWEQVNITGEIRFYTIYSLVDGKMTNANSRDGWVEWSAYFVDGKLNQLHLVENRVPEAPNAGAMRPARKETTE